MQLSDVLLKKNDQEGKRHNTHHRYSLSEDGSKYSQTLAAAPSIDKVGHRYALSSISIQVSLADSVNRFSVIPSCRVIAVPF